MFLHYKNQLKIIICFARLLTGCAVKKTCCLTPIYKKHYQNLAFKSILKPISFCTL